MRARALSGTRCYVLFGAHHGIRMLYSIVFKVIAEVRGTTTCSVPQLSAHIIHEPLAKKTQSTNITENLFAHSFLAYVFTILSAIACASQTNPIVYAVWLSFRPFFPKPAWLRSAKAVAKAFRRTTTKIKLQTEIPCIAFVLNRRLQNLPKSLSLLQAALGRSSFLDFRQPPSSSLRSEIT